MQTNFNPSNALGHEYLLNWTEHAYSNVRLATQKIVYVVRQHQFNGQFWILLVQSSEYRRQNLDTNDFTRCYAYRPADT